MAVPLHPEPARAADALIRPLWQYLALAALTALFLALAFPEPGWGIFAHVGLLPLVWLARHAERPRRLIWTTWLVSFAWWLVMIRWLIPITGGGYAGLAAYMAVYWPAFALIWRTIDRKLRWPAAITVPMVWVSLEYLRGTILQGGFGWYALSHSQAPYEPGDGVSLIIQVADLAGEWAVSFLVAMTSGMLVDVYAGWSKPRRDWNGISTAFVGWAILYVVAVGYYGVLRPGVTFDGTTARLGSDILPTVRVAVVQTDVPQSNKTSSSMEQQEKDWRRLMELINAASVARTHTERQKELEQSAPPPLPPRPAIVVVPETIVPFALNTEVNVEMLRVIRIKQLDPERSYLHFHNDLSTLAFDHQINLFAGAARYLPRSPETAAESWIVDNPLRWNSAYLYQSDGTQSVQRFDKIHRVPFGEFIPWVEDWPWLKALFLKYLSPYGEGNDYTLQQGAEYTVFDVQLPHKVGEEARAVRVVTPICFEDTLARACRPMVYDSDGNKRADVLINLTNDGWFGTDSERTAHFQIAVLRCVENRVPMVRSVNVGVSGFIDSAGRVGPFVEVDGKLQHVDGVAVADVVIDPRSTVFGYVGQIPVITLTCLTGALLLWATVRRR